MGIPEACREGLKRSVKKERKILSYGKKKNRLFALVLGC